MKIKTLSAAAGAATLLLFALASGCCATGGNDSRLPLTQTVWTLEPDSLPPGRNVTGKPMRPITLQIGEGNRVSGCAGVNRYTGSAAIDADAGKLQFGPQATTRMAGPGLDCERAYLNALAATRSFRIDGATLTLCGENGKVLAKFNAQPAAADSVSAQK